MYNKSLYFHQLSIKQIMYSFYNIFIKVKYLCLNISPNSVYYWFLYQYVLYQQAHKIYVDFILNISQNVQLFFLKSDNIE